MAFCSVVLASLALGTGIGPAPAPTTAKFRIESKNQTTVDLTAFGQPSQELSANITGWISLTLRDTTGGRVIHIIVDSAKFDGTVPLGPESVDSAKGGMIHGLLDSNGRVKNLASTPATNAVMAELQGVANGMFPRMKPAVAPGESWSDTSEVNNTAGGSNTKTVFQVSYTAGERQTVSGMAAIKVSAKSTSKVAVTVENPQMGTMEVEGTGVGTAVFSAGPDGRFLGGTLTSNVDQKVKASMAPAPIPIKSLRTVTVTLLP
jgi:hypothetical protein